jgi:hypothetical protein
MSNTKALDGRRVRSSPMDRRLGEICPDYTGHWPEARVQARKANASTAASRDEAAAPGCRSVDMTFCHREVTN